MSVQNYVIKNASIFCSVVVYTPTPPQIYNKISLLPNSFDKKFQIFVISTKSNLKSCLKLASSANFKQLPIMI